MKRKTIVIILIEIIILLMFYLFVNSEYLNILPECWVYNATGLLCPACGGTRCVTYLLNGKLIEAFLSHTIFFIGIMYSIILNVIYLINLNKEKKIGIWIYPKSWYAIIFAIALISYTIMRNLL